jgi:hypothetical protein
VTSDMAKRLLRDVAPIFLKLPIEKHKICLSVSQKHC